MKGKGKADLKCSCGFSWKGYSKEIDANILIGNWNCTEIDKLDKRMRHLDHKFVVFKGRKIYSLWQKGESHNLSKLKIAKSLTGLLKRL